MLRPHPGITILFTGLSGAGKSTVANVLLAQLQERGDQPATLLDGDVVRKHFSADLGFSKEDRDLNVRRVGFLASAITKSGGVAICALIAPYDKARKEVRAMIEATGGQFLLVHFKTPLNVCEQRDRKGLYAKAREGGIARFTGISDPYEAPSDAELVVDTTDITPEEAAQRITQYLECEAYLHSRQSSPVCAELTDDVGRPGTGYGNGKICAKLA